MLETSNIYLQYAVCIIVFNIFRLQFWFGNLNVFCSLEENDASQHRYLEP